MHANRTPQLKSKEEELLNLTSVHTASVAQYDRRVADLELRVARLTESNRQLELRRHLDTKGWTADVSALRKTLGAVECKLHEMRLVERYRVIRFFRCMKSSRGKKEVSRGLTRVSLWGILKQ